MGRPLNKRFFGPVVPGQQQVACQAWIAGDDQSRVGYIIEQTGTSRYKVHTSAGEADCYLVEAVTGPEQMTIQLDAEGTPGTQTARKLTDREIYTFQDNYYPYWNAVNGRVIYGTPSMGDYWIGAYGDLSADMQTEIAQGVTIDSQGNIITVGILDFNGTPTAFVTKMDKQSNVIWQQGVARDSNPIVGELVMVDSNDDIYAVFWDSDATTLIATKLDSDGNMLWQSALAGVHRAFDLDVHSDGSLVVATTNIEDPFATTVVAKWDNSGVLQWQQAVTANANDTQWGAVAFLSDGKMVLATVNKNLPVIEVMALDASGIIVWNKSFDTSGFASEPIFLAMDGDTAGNTVYLSWCLASMGGIGCMMKIGADGTLAWQRYFTSDVATVVAPISVKVDTDGSAFVQGFYLGAGYGGGIIVYKVTATGEIAWSTALLNGSTSFDVLGSRYSGTSGAFEDIAVDGDSVVFGAAIQIEGRSQADAMIARVPKDGSGVGEYGTFDYYTYPLESYDTEFTWSPGNAAVGSTLFPVPTGNLILTGITFNVETTPLDL